jgi:hypothetical protein
VSSIDGKALIALARSLGQFYPTKTGWRNLQIFAGVLSCLLVFTIPLGIWIIIEARKAGLAVTQEGFAFRYLTTVAARWDEVEKITPMGMGGATFGGGLVGVAAAAAVKSRTEGLKGPLIIKVKGKRTPLTIPAHTIEDSLHMASEMERLSGISFLPEDLKQN